MQLIGYHLWKKHLDSNKTVVVYHFSWTETLISFYTLAMIATFFYFEIPAYSRAVIGSYAYDGTNIKNIIPHLFDAVTDALSIIGEVLMLLRYCEQWIAWMISNILQLAMFSGIANKHIDINMVILWTFAIINASIGFKNGFLILVKTDKNPTLIIN